VSARPALTAASRICSIERATLPVPTKPRVAPTPISQATLADMVGTTRSRVSHFMNKFRKLGLITYNGHVEVNNSLLDAVLRDKPELKEDE
jgi:CRP/FNR family transcriptional regulator, cyclic AMP receptor protein